ncbi:XisI protein [Geminocystis sp. CENA526]|uniref:XisI protein n=1 Tax=Geminocystis sp. CENA526 TaxID=1355871 RepID=UPI003D6E4818
MDKISNFRQIIQELLIEHSKIIPVYGQIQMELLFDHERDRYQVIRVGWLQGKRVYGVLIHVDIIDEKIWIQYDGTEVAIANQLLNKGIVREDIVLGYQPPLIRQYSGFSACA